jgi:hypothetical protein
MNQLAPSHHRRARRPHWAWAGLPLLAVLGCASDGLPGAPASAGSAGANGLPATVARYIAPPLGQPAVRLLLRGAVPPGERFALLRLDDALQCQRPQLVTEGTAAQAAPAPVAMAAGVLTTLDFVVIRAGQSGCGVRWSFTPVAGHSYLVQGAVIGAGCSANVLDVTVPDRPTAPADAVLRSAAGQRCVPLAQARAMNTASLIQGGQLDGEAVLNPRANARELEGLIQP